MKLYKTIIISKFNIENEYAYYTKIYHKPSVDYILSDYPYENHGKWISVKIGDKFKINSVYWWPKYYWTTGWKYYICG